MPLKALKKVFGVHPQTLKRFQSLLCDAYVGLIRFNHPNGSFNDPFTKGVDKTSVITQTCKTSYHGIPSCVFRCANETVKRVKSCFCHGVCPLYSLPFQAVNVLRKPFPSRQGALYHTKKSFCKSFFQKTQKSFACEFAQNFQVWHKFCLYDYTTL